MLDFKIVAVATLGASALALSLLHFHGVAPRDSGDGIPGYSSLATVNIRSVPEERFAKAEEETELGYVSRISRTVNSTVYNCAADDFSLTWAERMVWILIGSPNIFADGILVRSRIDCGYCHQSAFLVHDALSAEGLSSEVWGLDGHVVLRFDFEGKTYFTDPDLGPGPFRVNLDGRPVIDVDRVYANSSAANIDALKVIYSNSENFAPYGGLDYAAHYQKRVFSFSNTISRLLGAAGLVAIFAALCLILYRFVNMGRSIQPVYDA